MARDMRVKGGAEEVFKGKKKGKVEEGGRYIWHREGMGRGDRRQGIGGGGESRGFK